MATGKPVSILEEILQWSADRPAWQRDALRRLLQNGDLTDDDIQELTLICKSQHALAPAQTPTPLSKEHIPTGPVAGKTVTLCSIKDVRNANALAANQTLKFGSTGLTIVYGDNGSGKSGYARILKRACRARARGETILPNVFGKPTKEPAEATIKYRVDGAEQQPFVWRDDQTGSAELSAVSFFDSDCAAVQVKDPNDLAFTPFGLDVFEKLAAVCKSIKGTLDQDKKGLDAAKPVSWRQPKAKPHTAVAKVCAGFTASSKIDPIKALASLSNEELGRLAHLRSVRDDDPQKAINALRAQQQRVKQLADIIDSVKQVFGEAGATTAFQQATAAATAASEAAKLAAIGNFSEEPLQGVGTEVWKGLWEAARKYSEQAAYPGVVFPATEQGRACVLCQQQLGDAAADRLRRFEVFVADDTQTKAREAAQHVRKLIGDVERLQIRRGAFKPTLADLDAFDTSAAEDVRRLLITGWILRRQVLKGLKTGSWNHNLPALPGYPTPKLDKITAEIGLRIAEIQKSTAAAERAKLIAELDELEAREWLGAVLDDVQTEIDRLQQLKLIQQCARDTETTAITAKGSALADEAVTNALRDRFAQEIARLEIAHARVELVPAGGKYGTKRYQVQLVAAPGTGVHCVLSEGEHRCIAIAGFLAELAISSDKSALVFDDPVSSLDHRHRDTVAKRLVEEAQERQVIVFTHDVVFAFKLDKWANANNMEPHQQSVNRTISQPGFCSSDAPLRVKAVRQSVVHLKKRAKDIAELYSEGKIPEYEEQARSLFGRIRETWEAAVAEALSPVLNRFERDVDTKKLRALTVITDADCDVVNAQRALCAKYQHNEAGAVNEPMAEPDQIYAALEVLQVWMDSVVQRQKAVEQGKQTVAKLAITVPQPAAETLQ